MKEIEEKYNILKEKLLRMESVVVAFSGGVDSTFLLKVAKNTLRRNVLAVTARSSTYPSAEMNEAGKLAEEVHVEHLVICSEELDIAGFSENPVDRCYYCKGELFSKLKDIAAARKINFVIDGSNLDDAGDFRPGMQAAAELGVQSPLKDSFLTKSDIRLLSKRLNLPTWNKPAFACLASRFPYGEPITAEKLLMVDKAEIYLRGLGFTQVRVRHHGTIARVEIECKEQKKIFESNNRCDIINELKSIGFKYIAVDLEGYRTGSMNEVI